MLSATMHVCQSIKYCRTSCRCAERMVVGEANISTAGGTDLAMANNIAREMVYRCGFSKRLGPIALMDTEEVYLNRERSRSIANISTPLARIATEEVQAVRYLTLFGFVPPLTITFTLLACISDAGVASHGTCWVS